jgi:hypothetical protein
LLFGPFLSKRKQKNDGIQEPILINPIPASIKLFSFLDLKNVEK